MDLLKLTCWIYINQFVAGYLHNLYFLFQYDIPYLSHYTNDQALSQPVAVLLLVAITVILAAMVLLLFHLPSFNLGIATPSFLQILHVYHQDEKGYLNYDSRIILVNTGTSFFDNKNLRAEFFRNGTKIPAVIETMNGDLFISTHHSGIQTMGGLGCSGPTWLPQEKISIDFSDGTFHPGDQIRMDVFQKPSGTLISRHMFLA